ncbi:hypothetical protein V1498_03040 [Peribacillus sp. SCS-26]|uniref:hypothetical protein n=1 Tax=Paraperibacillus marinus TaxID=3115295 RepID=UPI0039065E52
MNDQEIFLKELHLLIQEYKACGELHLKEEIWKDIHVLLDAITGREMAESIKEPAR